MTIHSVTQQILEADYVASESLRRDLLNLNAYAESIKSEVEELLGEEANEKAIAVALSRIAKEPLERKTFEGKLFTDYNVKSGHCIISVEKKLTEQFLNKWRRDHPEAHRFTQLFTYGACSLLVNQEEKSQLLQYIQKKNILSIHDNLFVLTAMFTQDFSENKYVAVTLIKELSNKGVNLYCHFLSPTGVGVVIQEEDLTAATAVFTKLIQ